MCSKNKNLTALGLDHRRASQRRMQTRVLPALQRAQMVPSSKSSDPDTSLTPETSNRSRLASWFYSAVGVQHPRGIADS